MSCELINVSAIRALVNGKRRRVSRDFLELLNQFVKERIEDACHIKNGGKKTLDSTLAIYVGFNPSTKIERDAQ